MHSQLPRTFIIAEAGVNHNGDINLAKKLIEKAKEAGADAVKFQTFSAEKLALKGLEKADYQKRNEDIIESQYDMLKRLELSLESHHLLKKHCKSLNINFMSSTFDNESTDFLVNNMLCDVIKVGSGELTNAPLLFHLARKQVSIILSTGMSNLSEIEQALSALAFGYLFQKNTPQTRENFLQAYYST
ncbi:MAG: N-acetylneuraminate synthase family protein, partial [Alphaproteobacteria bacterium]|nr:N-acetylneuraminate synthase family protein [Alphaproteobacteria bacterium]